MRRDETWLFELARWLNRCGCPACGARVTQQDSPLQTDFFATCGWRVSVSPVSWKTLLRGHCAAEFHDSFPALRRLEAMIDRQKGVREEERP